MRIGSAGQSADILGLGAVALGTFAHCWGSVLGRPLIAHHGAPSISLATIGLGGVTLTGLSLAFDRPGAADFAAFLRPEVAGSFLFLVMAAVVAWTIHLRLVRDWGVMKAGLYAFISPLIAVATGVILAGERFGPGDIAAMALMLGATWIALRRPFDRLKP